jgi:hypothetical protein
MSDRNESERYELPSELAALEKSLAGMMPVMPRVDRDQLMFAAGMARSEVRGARSGKWFWPAATAASVMLAVALWRQTPSPNGPKSVIANQPAVNTQPAELDEVIVNRFAAAPWSDLTNSGYLGLRNTALARGIGALPQEPQFAGAQDQRSQGVAPYVPATSRDLLKEFLPKDASGAEPRS